ncbi:MAG: FAD-binding protein [Candidatus Dormibacteraeota bacterium]|nr:FAD-binding protein [Candidatus Dormibacteraeota bacterium]
MSAALEAAEAGASVLLASGEPGSSELAQGGIAAAVGEDDSPGSHAADTVAAGAGLCDPDVVVSLTGAAPETISWLAAHGVAFDREQDGRPSLALEAAHARPRVVHAGGDDSGATIAGALRAALTGLTSRLTRLDGARLQELVVDLDGVAGGRLTVGGDEVEVAAEATILATGGYAGLFTRSTTTMGCDGSGLLAALDAGAALADLEFVQFHPTAYAGPGRPFLLTEALRGAGAQLVDLRGHRFLIGVDPRAELAPRAVVTRAVVEHLRSSADTHAFLDARPVGAGRLEAEFPGFLARCRSAGLDPVTEPVPIIPAAHYTMGGIVTDRQGRTAVPGLLAAGECARTGVHGANRLASNSLLEAVVFGRRAARAALGGRFGPGTTGSAGVRRAQSGGRGTELELEEVRDLLDQSAGPLRCREELQAALTTLTEARGTTDRAEGARRLALLVVQAALLREESRGAHVRTDHPREVGAWAGCEVVIGAGPEVRPRAA